MTSSIDAHPRSPLEPLIASLRAELATALRAPDSSSEDAAEFSAEQRGAHWTLGAHAKLDRARVVRWGAVTSAAYTRQQWDAQSQWAAVRASGALLGGLVRASVGGGHIDAPAHSAERLQMAPSLAWVRPVGALSLRLFGERVVDPLWSDLSPGTPAFVQDVWTEGLDAAVLRANGDGVGAGVMALQTGARARTIRYPLRDFVLRNGWRRADADRALVLATAHVRTHWRAIAADASGWALSRPHTRDEARVDPSVGARAGVQTRFRAFSNDLGALLRLDASFVGSRDADPDAGGFAGSLPSYTTLSGTASFTLGDVTLVLRGDQLEGTRHPEVWTDPVQATPTPALGPGRRMRIEAVWALFN